MRTKWTTCDAGWINGCPAPPFDRSSICTANNDDDTSSTSSNGGGGVRATTMRWLHPLLRHLARSLGRRHESSWLITQTPYSLHVLQHARDTSTWSEAAGTCTKGLQTDSAVREWEGRQSDFYGFPIWAMITNIWHFVAYTDGDSLPMSIGLESFERQPGVRATAIPLQPHATPNVVRVLETAHRTGRILLRWLPGSILASCCENTDINKTNVN